MNNHNLIASAIFDCFASYEVGRYLDSGTEKNEEIAEFFRKLNIAMEDGTLERILERILMELSRNGGGSNDKHV